MYEDVLKFFRMVRRMRTAQVAYERCKNTVNLNEVVKWENTVDFVVRYFFSGVPAQLQNDKDDDLPF